MVKYETCQDAETIVQKFQPEVLQVLSTTSVPDSRVQKTAN